MKLTKVEVRGQSFEVHVNDDGKFFANVGGDQVTAPSLDELRTKIGRATLRRSKSLSILFVEWHQGKIRRGVCTGRHATNRNLLVKWEGVKGVEQVSSWNGDTWVNPEREAEYVALCQAADKANDVRRKFEKLHTIPVGKVIDQAYEEAEKAEGVA